MKPIKEAAEAAAYLSRIAPEAGAEDASVKAVSAYKLAKTMGPKAGSTGYGAGLPRKPVT